MSMLAPQLDGLSISELNYTISKIVDNPGRSFTLITDAVSREDVPSSVIAGLAILKKRLNSHVERTRSQVSLSALAYAGATLMQLDHLPPAMETFYCTAHEAHVVARIVTWQVSKRIRKMLADPTVGLADKNALMSIRDAYGFKK